MAPKAPFTAAHCEPFRRAVLELSQYPGDLAERIFVALWRVDDARFGSALDCRPDHPVRVVCRRVQRLDAFAVPVA